MKTTLALRSAVLATLTTVAVVVALAVPSAAATPTARHSAPTGTLTLADWELLETGHGPQIQHLFLTYEKTHPGVQIKF